MLHNTVHTDSVVKVIHRKHRKHCPGQCGHLWSYNGPAEDQDRGALHVHTLKYTIAKRPTLAQLKDWDVIRAIKRDRAAVGVAQWFVPSQMFKETLAGLGGDAERAGKH